MPAVNTPSRKRGLSVKTKTVQQGDPDAIKISQAHLKADWQLVVRLCRHALRKNSQHLRAHQMLGHALDQLYETDEALAAYRLGAALHPDNAELLINYAVALQKHGRSLEAVPIMEKVCTLKPGRVEPWLKLAQSCYPCGQHGKALEAIAKAEKLAVSLDDKLAVLNQRAIHRRELGQVREAVQDCETAIGLFPNDPSHHTNRLLFMLADPATNAEQLARAAREFAAVFEAPHKAHWPDHAERREGGPWRRLRVGFFSPDFRHHAVMYFIEGLIAQLDRRQFEVWALSLHSAEDSATERIRRHADHFEVLAHRTPDEQARMIREAKIDILIDLAGHTGGNGLIAMVRKPAPVQLSWLGYPATTGLTAIDYKLTDEVADPSGAEVLYTEQLYRLPTLYGCYRPHTRNPLWRYQPAYTVRPTPALRNGYVTFGSCNNLGKLTDEVLTLWSRILTAVPNARLLIEGKGFDRKEFADQYRERCARLGIDIARLELLTLNQARQYLTYHGIDIALDPFPQTGGTTTFDTLWMGVPVVTMEGMSFQSRMSTAILCYLGRTEWIAQSQDAYLHIAVALATDVNALDVLRQSLRREVEASVLMREDWYTRHYGEALRLMWLRWLAQNEHPGDDEAQAHLMESWLPSLPPEWAEPAEPGVGLAEGERVPLSQAHQKIQAMVDRAKAKRSDDAPTISNVILKRDWLDITNLAEKILCAVPHDPVALACLAEVEHAHGHTDFAVTYLQYAQEAILRRTQTTSESQAAPPEAEPISQPAQLRPRRARLTQPKFRFVVSTPGTQEHFFAETATGRSLLLYQGMPDIQLFLNCNNTVGLHNTFNRAIEQSRDNPAVLIIMHADIHLCDAFWREHILDSLEHFDLVGLAGNKRRVPSQPSWYFSGIKDGKLERDAVENLSGSVSHGTSWPPKMVSMYGPTRQEVKLVDGLFLVAHSQTFIDHDIRFDPLFDFHFYDLDICRQFEAKGLRIGTWDISVVHESTGGAFGSPNWLDAWQKYQQKWEN